MWSEAAAIFDTGGASGKNHRTVMQTFFISVQVGVEEDDNYLLCCRFTQGLGKKCNFTEIKWTKTFLWILFSMETTVEKKECHEPYLNTKMNIFIAKEDLSHDSLGRGVGGVGEVIAPSSAVSFTCRMYYSHSSQRTNLPGASSMVFLPTTHRHLLKGSWTIMFDFGVCCIKKTWFCCF